MKPVENLKKLIRDESGQNLPEYALIAALIALGSVAAMKGLVTGIGKAFHTICTNLNN
jgi:pilus assembly protein Flp/PilA